MPSFYNVLDDAWLGSSLIATSDDSLVVRIKNESFLSIYMRKIIEFDFV